jgi:hypothetical protein
MKKLLTVIAIMLSLTACKKQTSEQLVSQQEEIQTGAWQTRDLFVHVAAESQWPAFTIPNYKGAAFEVTVQELKLQGDYTKSCWIAISGKTSTGRTIWAQWGWFNLDRGVEQAFQVWDLDTRSMVSVDFVNSGLNVPLNAGEVVRFEIVNIEGTTWWEFKRNGLVVFKADLLFDTAGNFPIEVGSKNKIEVATESRGGDSFSPELHVNYVEYYKDGVWSIVPSGRANVSVIGSNGRTGWWNIRSGVNPSEFYIGGRGQVVIGSLIW